MNSRQVKGRKSLLRPKQHKQQHATPILVFRKSTFTLSE